LAKGQVAQIAGEVWGLASPYYRVAVPDGTDVEIDCPGPEWGRAMALAAGVATSTHTRVTPTVMLNKPGLIHVSVPSGDRHVWLTVCGKAGLKRQERFSLTLRGSDWFERGRGGMDDAHPPLLGRAFSCRESPLGRLPGVFRARR